MDVPAADREPSPAARRALLSALPEADGADLVAATDGTARAAQTVAGGHLVRAIDVGDRVADVAAIVDDLRVASPLAPRVVGHDAAGVLVLDYGPVASAWADHLTDDPLGVLDLAITEQLTAGAVAWQRAEVLPAMPTAATSARLLAAASAHQVLAGQLTQVARITNSSSSTLVHGQLDACAALIADAQPRPQLSVAGLWAAGRGHPAADIAGIFAILLGAFVDRPASRPVVEGALRLAGITWVDAASPDKQLRAEALALTGGLLLAGIPAERQSGPGGDRDNVAYLIAAGLLDGGLDGGADSVAAIFDLLEIVAG